MNIKHAANLIKEMYRGHQDSDEVWSRALEEFNIALINETDAIALEQCVLDDNNWELHVEGRIALLRKAKSLGANSKDFLLDYYGYLAAHLDEGPEQFAADVELSKLLGK